MMFSFVYLGSDFMLDSYFVIVMRMVMKMVMRMVMRIMRMIRRSF